MTGVRFQFGLCGGYYSTIYNGCGQNGGTGILTNSNWVPNIRAFFDDLYSAQIYNITPTPSFSGFGGESGIIYYDPTDPNLDPAIKNSLPAHYNDPEYDYCQKTYITYRWWPGSPYPLAFDGTAPDFTYNRGYDCAPTNNRNFIGWNLYEQAIETIVSAAYNSGVNRLNIRELDLGNEVDLSDFTVEARLIVDNKNGDRQVLQDVRNILSRYGYDLYAATFSVPDAGQTDDPRTPCTTSYGDSGRVLYLSELLAGIGGGYIGIPPYDRGHRQGNMYCVDTPHDPAAAGMYKLPYNYLAGPKVLDAHTPGACPGYQDAGGCYPNSQQTVAEVAAEAEHFFSGVQDLMDSFCIGNRRNINGPSIWPCGGNFTLGEAPIYLPVSPGSTDSCEGIFTGAPLGEILGFNGSTLAGRDVVIRPWSNSSFPTCYTLPAPISPYRTQ